MALKLNYHTHTQFCDGHNTAEEMVQAAIEKHFDILGFSGHSMFPFARSWHIAPRDFSAYEKEIERLKQKYSSSIKILTGYEADYFPGVTVPSKKEYIRAGLSPEYLIGSVHYVVSDKGHYSVDNSTEKVRSNLLRLYGNKNTSSQSELPPDMPLMEAIDGKKAVCEYFAAQREMLAKGDFEILGHCDLIRKRNGQLKFFNEKENWYLQELKETAKQIARAGVIVEVNTGAIARKAMDDFYPSFPFLQLLQEQKVPVMINSDAHNAFDLDCAFDRALYTIKKAGFREITYPLAGSFLSFKI